MGRAWRLELVAGLGIALALPALALSAENSKGLPTQTTLTAETRDVGGRTQASLNIAVAGRDGSVAAGTVEILDNGKPLAGVALDSEGRATAEVTLAPGDHSLTASYAGDNAHASSASESQAVSADTSAAPDFSIAVAPTSVTLKPGQSGSVVATVTPISAASLTAPMFVTLSCSGLPDQSACTFTPQSLEILPNATTAVTSTMVLTTVAGTGVNAQNAPKSIGPSRPVAWAILLPGALGLAGLAFGARRRTWLRRLSLLGVVALVGVLGTTGCNPLYGYRNHGPTGNLPTPAGSYTIKVTAQSSNGVTATTHSTTMALTVQ